MYLGCRITLRSENRVIILAVETLFDIAQQARDREREYEVQHAYNKVRLERLKILPLYYAGKIVELRYSDNIKHRCILNIYNELVADRRKNITYNLRKCTL